MKGQLSLCRCANIRIIGIVENMCAFRCPNCSHCSTIFPEGPIKEFAESEGIDHLGSVGLDPTLSDVFDLYEGDFSLEECAQSQQLSKTIGIVKRVEKYFSSPNSTM